MWLLGLNGVVYLVYNLLSGRFRRDFLPISPQTLWRELRLAAQFRLDHQDLNHYNALQRVAYLGVVLALVVVVLSGLVLWKHVQFPWLNVLMGGYEGARLVHFFAMASIVAFVLMHLAMVLLVPRTLAAMIGLFAVPLSQPTATSPAPKGGRYARS
jgi:thiosulfate reductase cytochrome b subunit